VGIGLGAVLQGFMPAAGAVVMREPFGKSAGDE